jgi:hypothetical protein
MWTTSLKGTIKHTKDFHEAIVNTRNDLHEQLNLMFHLEAWKTKAEIRIKKEWKPRPRPFYKNSRYR